MADDNWVRDLLQRAMYAYNMQINLYHNNNMKFIIQVLGTFEWNVEIKYSIIVSLENITCSINDVNFPTSVLLCLKHYSINILNNFFQKYKKKYCQCIEVSNKIGKDMQFWICTNESTSPISYHIFKFQYFQVVAHRWILHFLLLGWNDLMQMCPDISDSERNEEYFGFIMMCYLFLFFISVNNFSTKIC